MLVLLALGRELGTQQRAQLLQALAVEVLQHLAKGIVPDCSGRFKTRAKVVFPLLKGDTDGPSRFLQSIFSDRFQNEPIAFVSSLAKTTST